MALSHIVRPKLNFMTDEQCERIHHAALEILRHTGVQVFHEEALKLLKDAGCIVKEENKVFYPPQLVEWALKQPPSVISLCSRGSGEEAAPLYERNVNFGPGSDCVTYIDPKSGERRPCTLEDITKVYRLVDSLPQLDFIMSCGIPSDFKGNTYRKQYAEMIKNTTKPVVFVCDDGEDCERIISAAAYVAGGDKELEMNPTLLLYSEPSTPLKQSRTAMEKLLIMAKTATPVVHSPAPMMGGTAPTTIAGGLAIGTAEALSGLVIHQLKRTGAPFAFGSGLNHLDMRTSVSAYGAPEFQLARLGIADMGRYYKLPTWGYSGHSDTCVFDEQAAADAVFSVYNALHSGTNLIHDVGYIEAGLTQSPEMMVYTAEIISMLRYFFEGIKVDDETLAVDVIHNVGSSGDFMTEDHTMRHFRDFWEPSLIARQRYEAWESAGSKTMKTRVKEKAVALMDEAKGTPLEDSKAEEVEYILGLKER